jgi:predicted HNH restriction endonuclease
MGDAIFLNGVYEDVLQEICAAQSRDPELTCYLQPYSARHIRLLESRRPSVASPVPVYISTTTAFGAIRFAGQIVAWEDKQTASKERLAAVGSEMKKNQPVEANVYLDTRGGKLCLNLLSIKHLSALPNPLSVTNLVKLSNATPVKPRTRAGGWVYVRALPDWVGVTETAIRDELEEDLRAAVAKSLADDDGERNRRLAKAQAMPARVQVLSYAFRRNADVIAAVLRRAHGRCESCDRDAPFLRVSDGTPFLEIHHKVPLAAGGEDTVANATALCPNCHRKMHFGA